PDAAAAETVDAPGRGDWRHPHAENAAFHGRLDLGEVDGLQRNPDHPAGQTLHRPQVLPLGPAVDILLDPPGDFPGTAGRDALEQDCLHARAARFLRGVQRLFFVMPARVGVDVDRVRQVVHGRLVGAHAVTRLVGSDDSSAYHRALARDVVDVCGDYGIH